MNDPAQSSPLVAELIRTHKPRGAGRPPSGAVKPPPLGPMVRVGKSLCLRTVRSGAALLGMKLNGFTRLLKVMRIPLIALGNERYYNEAMLELGIFMVTYFKMAGFAAPGSDAKNQGMDPLPDTLPKGFPRRDQISKALVSYRKLAQTKAGAADATVRRLLKDKTVDLLKDAQ